MPLRKCSAFWPTNHINANVQVSRMYAGARKSPEGDPPDEPKGVRYSAFRMWFARELR